MKDLTRGFLRALSCTSPDDKELHWKAEERAGSRTRHTLREKYGKDNEEEERGEEDNE